MQPGGDNDEPLQTFHVVFGPTIPDAARSIALRLARMAAGASSSEAFAIADEPGEIDCRCPSCRGDLGGGIDD
jgi:hypothetical protein